MEQKAPNCISWRFTPKRLAKKTDESASVAVGDGMVPDDGFPRKFVESNALSFLSASRL